MPAEQPYRLTAFPSYRLLGLPGKKSGRPVIGRRGRECQTPLTRHQARQLARGERPMSTTSYTTAEIPAWSEDPLTARARSVWTSGDFLPIARSFAAGAEDFSARLALRQGESVLDVACGTGNRSEEHTSELQSQFHLVCRLLLEKKKKKQIMHQT